MQKTELPLSARPAGVPRAVSQDSLKSRRSEYGSLLFRSDQMTRTITTAPTASRADLDSLVNKYNLMRDIGMAAKRDMTRFKVDVADLRSGVSTYQSLTGRALDNYHADLLNEVHADLEVLAQEMAEESRTHQLLTQEVRDLNLEMKHMNQVVRDSLAQVQRLESFTGVGKLRRLS